MKKNTITNMVSAESGADSQKFTGKLKEIAALASFVLVIALISVISMDLLLVPLISFSKKSPGLYTEIFTITIIVLIGLYILFRISSVIIYWKKNGFTLKEIISSILAGRLRSFLVFIISLAAVLICIGIIYYLFTFNHTLFSEMAG